MPRYSNARGRRVPELGNKYFRSKMEANIARMLQHWKDEGHIKEWEYEPQTFVFTGIKNGAVCYKPDFRITELGGDQYWLEVKGRETSRDRTKWKRMAAQYPEEYLVVCGPTMYEAYREQWAGRVPGWE